MITKNGQIWHYMTNKVMAVGFSNKNRCTPQKNLSFMEELVRCNNSIPVTSVTTREKLVLIR